MCNLLRSSLNLIVIFSLLAVQAPYMNSKSNFSLPTTIQQPVKALTSSMGIPEELVTIPAGNFQMGCNINDDGFCFPGETPLHTVYLDAFSIDKYEITNGQYRACVTAGGCTPPSSNASKTRPSYYDNPNLVDYPVINVTWDQAKSYCTWSGNRLPTEAEWEKAARGSSDTRTYPWGNTTPTCSMANYAVNDTNFCVGDTSRVGSYPNGASPYNVMDMMGNVWEYVNDWYSEAYYSTSPVNNPTGPVSGTKRVVRGGAWDFWPGDDRVDTRCWYNHGHCDTYKTSTGFRCASSHTDEGVSADLSIDKEKVVYAQSANTKEDEPYKTALQVFVNNNSSTPIDNVYVDFYNGQPGSGVLLGTVKIARIDKFELATFFWDAPSGSEATVYAKVYVLFPDSDPDLSNNVTDRGVKVKVYYTDFKYDPDTFNFENPPFSWDNMKAEVIENLKPYLPGNILLETWRWIIGPIIYGIFSNGGHCYGMAETSIVFKRFPQEKPGGYTTQTYIIPEDQAMPYIRDHHARQLVNLPILMFGSGFSPSPKDSYERLLQRLRDQDRPAILSMQENCGLFEGCSNHAVTAFKAVETDDKKYVIIYDSKIPMLSPTELSNFAVFDLAANTFNYGGIYTKAYIEDPIYDKGEISLLIYELYNDMASQLISSNTAQVFLGSPATALLTDQYGRRIGYIGSQFVNEIPNATVKDFSGKYQFLVPANLSYTIQTSGTGSGTLDLSFWLPIDDINMQEVVYTDVPVSLGSVTTTHLSRFVNDWQMDLGNGVKQPPTIARVSAVSSIHNQYLPYLFR